MSKMKAVMLWISDTLKLGIELKSVCVMGTIVNVLYTPYVVPDQDVRSDKVSNKPSVYEIDDGTGVLRVSHFLQKTTKKWPLEIGTTIEVRGTPQIFREQLEIKAFSVKVFDNPNDEVERMLIVDQFRQTSAYQNLFACNGD